MEEEGAVRKRRKHNRGRKLLWRGHKGRKWTPEQREEVRARAKAFWDDPERRAALLAKRADSQAKWQGVGRREGIPDGMRREKADVLNNKAKESAKKTMAELEKSGVLVDDSTAAKEALESAITVMRSPGSKQIQLSAAKLVLEYTKSKPVAKSLVTVNAAEEWLKAVADDSAVEGEATADA